MNCSTIKEEQQFKKRRQICHLCGRSGHIRPFCYIYMTFPRRQTMSTKIGLGNHPRLSGDRKEAMVLIGAMLHSLLFNLQGLLTDPLTMDACDT